MASTTLLPHYRTDMNANRFGVVFKHADHSVVLFQFKLDLKEFVISNSCTLLIHMKNHQNWLSKWASFVGDDLPFTQKYVSSRSLRAQFPARQKSNWHNGWNWERYIYVFVENKGFSSEERETKFAGIMIFKDVTV